MELTITSFISEYGLYVFLAVLIVAALVILIAYLFSYTHDDYQEFEEDLIEAKEVSIAININLRAKTVLKYYTFNPRKKTETIPLDEFFVKFDHSNTVRLKSWLESINEIQDSFKVRHQEFVMYDEDNNKRIYLVELQSFIKDEQSYFLTFKDVTDEVSVFRRADKVASLSETEEFFNQSNDFLSKMDDAERSYLTVIKYKERPYALKELKPEVLQFLDDVIYKKLNLAKKDNEIITNTQYGYILLFSKAPVSLVKFKKDLKLLLQSCSGTYDMLKNKFSYSVTLVAGYAPLSNHEKVNMDKAVDVATAADVATKKSRFSDRISVYDDTLESLKSERNSKLVAIERIIMSNQFIVNYDPIINAKEKSVSGYSVSISLPYDAGMDINEFNLLVRQRFFRTFFYSKIFDSIYSHYKQNNVPHYITFDFEDAERIVNAFALQERLSEIDIFFCIEINNKTMHEYSFNDIDKQLDRIRTISNFKVGIVYNSLTPISLNDRILLNSDVMILGKKLIEKLNESFYISSLVEGYSKLAKQYDLDIVSFGVENVAEFDILSHIGVNKFGGKYLSNYVSNGLIKEKRVIKEIDDILNRNY